MSSESFERARQMVDLGIGYDGLHYTYNGYRYHRLADAVAYAQLMRSRPMQEDAGGRCSSVSALAPPNDAQRSLMDSLAIDFRDGAYRLKGFRYDGLADAVNYARLTLQRQDKDCGKASAPPAGTVPTPAPSSTPAMHFTARSDHDLSLQFASTSALRT